MVDLFLDARLKGIVFSLWVCFFCLAGCTGRTHSPLVIPLTEPAPQRTEFPTATVTFTATASKTPGTKLDPTPTQTQTPEPASPTHTPVVIPFSEHVSLSPDGKWEAAVEGEIIERGSQSERSQVMLMVSQQDGNQRWLAGFEEHNADGSTRTPIPLAWSRDGKYLYFTHQNQVMDICLGEDAFWGSDLDRLNLQSGEINALVPTVGFWLALSPDETQLAYLGGKFPYQLFIRDLASGKERSAVIQELKQYDALTHVSDLVWSPDGQWLVFVIRINVCFDEGGEKYSLYRVNASTLEREQLIQEDDRRLKPVAWTDPGKIQLRDKTGQEWQLEVGTWKLSPVR